MYGPRAIAKAAQLTQALSLLFILLLRKAKMMLNGQYSTFHDSCPMGE